MKERDPQGAARAKIEHSRTLIREARTLAELALERLDRCIEMVRRLGGGSKGK